MFAFHYFFDIMKRMESEKKSNGALVGSIIIIIILVIGGIYMWQSKIKSDLNKKQTQTENTAPINDINQTQ
jgi:heme/copper-type cytochrome/quinol oxidase subunit 4